jgi:hypothetical protein
MRSAHHNTTNIVIEPVAAPTQVKLPLAEFAAPWVRYTMSINGTRCRLESGFRRGVRLLRLTCRAADGPVPPSLTPSGLNAREFFSSLMGLFVRSRMLQSPPTRPTPGSARSFVRS